MQTSHNKPHYTHMQSINGLQWIPYNLDNVSHLNLDTHRVIHSLILNRIKSIDKINRFCNKSLSSLRSPFLIPNMQKGVDRILYALSNNQQLCIIGDDDLDGISSVATLTYFLRTLGGHVSFKIPSRLPCGHILDTKTIQSLSNHVSLIITVDLGISAKTECTEMLQHGMDVIITDHHIPNNTSNIPLGSTIINPQLYNTLELYPEKLLTGVGLAFKLAHAIYLELNSKLDYKLPFSLIENLTEFVAMGTIADAGILIEDNRVLVAKGVEHIYTGSNHIGLQCLIEHSLKSKTKDFSPTNEIDLITKLSAKINSLGRISNAHNGVELLLAEKPDSITNLINLIEATNTKRQKLEKAMWVTAIETLTLESSIKPSEAYIIVDIPNGHPGITSIISTKIMKNYNKITFVIVPVSDHLLKISIRSIPEFPIIPMLQKLSHLFITFGGHNMAAGLIIHKDNLPVFKTQINIYISVNIASPPTKKLFIDAHLPLHAITNNTVAELKTLAPFGHGNPIPIFWDIVHIQKINREKQHIHISLKSGHKLYMGIYRKNTIPETYIGKDCFIAYSPPILATSITETVPFYIDPQTKIQYSYILIEDLLMPDPGEPKDYIQESFLSLASGFIPS